MPPSLIGNLVQPSTSHSCLFHDCRKKSLNKFWEPRIAFSMPSSASSKGTLRPYLHTNQLFLQRTKEFPTSDSVQETNRSQNPQQLFAHKLPAGVCPTAHSCEMESNFIVILDWTCRWNNHCRPLQWSWKFLHRGECAECSNEASQWRKLSFSRQLHTRKYRIQESNAMTTWILPKYKF